MGLNRASCARLRLERQCGHTVAVAACQGAVASQELLPNYCENISSAVVSQPNYCGISSSAVVSQELLPKLPLPLPLLFFLFPCFCFAVAVSVAAKS